VPELTSLADFRVERGAELLARRGDGSTIDGFLEVAKRQGWQVVPAAAYAAMPSGKVEDDVFEAFWKDVAETIAAEGGGLSAVFLSLHGAMVTETLHDVEGELLARLRSTPAIASLPIFGVFDLHANFTERMAENANALVCYRENPHIDARDSAVRAADLLARALATGVVPRMRRRNSPIIWPPTGTGTADTPMRDLEAAARAIEREDPSIWAAMRFSRSLDPSRSGQFSSWNRQTISVAALPATEPRSCEPCSGTDAGAPRR
jgi:microcystin degradation protein MlrC